MKVLPLLLTLATLATSCRTGSSNKTMDDQPLPADRMQSFTVNGFSLSGAEYWPYIADQEFNYPDDVLWGFYPEQATEKAVACATTAFQRLQAFLNSNPEKMKKVVELGATRRFYLWTDDYTTASANRARRKNSMWHWNSGDHDYAKGYWKWESVVTQTGECHIPQDAQIDAALTEAIQFLQGTH
jgi:hypothetical protein